MNFSPTMTTANQNTSILFDAVTFVHNKIDDHLSLKL
jgi:hypothetical protein